MEELGTADKFGTIRTADGKKERREKREIKGKETRGDVRDRTAILFTGRL